MLTPERIKELSEKHLLVVGAGYVRPLDATGFAHAIEAEVRKDDDALIRQMLEALEDAHGDSEEVLGHYQQLYSERYRPHRLHAQEDVVAKGQAAITAARARLEKAP